MLELEMVSVRFGGIRALRDVLLTVPAGEVRGLIGPNGSGKTTLLNAVSGFVRLAGGLIRVGGVRIDHWRPDLRAARGLARSFQGAATFGELDPVENVLVGYHKWDRHVFWRALVPISHEQLVNANRSTARSYLAQVGLRSNRLSPASGLPYGQQRLLDLARAFSIRPKVFLLDEPAAGLTVHEIDQLSRLIQEARHEGITILLVEHRMQLVMDLCDRVTVLDFGLKIAEGTPQEVQSNAAVIEAYLGKPRS